MSTTSRIIATTRIKFRANDWAQQRKEEKKLRVRDQPSIIGNFTENTYARDEQSRIFSDKMKESRRAFEIIVRIVGTARVQCGREKHSRADKLKTRVKERIEDGKHRARKTFRRVRGAVLLEKKAYVRFSCSCFLNRSHDTEHRLRNGTKRRLPPEPLKRSSPTVGNARAQGNEKESKNVFKVTFCRRWYERIRVCVCVCACENSSPSHFPSLCSLYLRIS